MKGVILTVLLAVLAGCLCSCFGNAGGVQAALQQQQNQEVEKQQQLSIDRSVNDNENRKSIPKTLTTHLQPHTQTENGTLTNTNIQSTLNRVSGAGQVTSSSSSSSSSSKGLKQQVPTVSPISASTNHRQHPQTHHPTASATTSTTATSASSTTTTTASSLLLPLSTTALSTTTTTTGAAMALASAASTISSVRAEPPPDSGLKLPVPAKHQLAGGSSSNSSKQRPKQPPQAAQTRVQQQLLQRASNDINEPPASSSKTFNDNNNNININIIKNKNNNKQQEQHTGELIDRMPTSQSVSFSEPESLDNRKQSTHRSDDQAKQLQQQQQASLSQYQGGPIGGNRWTHFGARLKPLGSGSGDHYETATSNSKSQTAFKQQHQHQPKPHYRQQQQQPNKQQQLAPARTRPAPANQRPLDSNNNNQVNSVADSNDDENDQDQDSEALLYKMLQQQNFLLSPNWQQEAQDMGTGSGATDQQGPATNGLSAGRRQPVASSNQLTDESSKRMIKLLKSYSHIHQVDDSDDQIRGTGTRLAAPRRPATNSRGSARQGKPPASRPTHQVQHNNSLRPGRPNQLEDAHADARPIDDNLNNNNNNNNNSEANESNDSPNQLDQPEEDSSSGQDAGQASAAAAAASPEGAEAEPDEFECPNNGIFADEASGCQAYHVCQSGAQVQQKFQCPMGTLFNNIILTCDFAHNVQCGKASNKSPDAQPPAPAGVDQSDTIYRQAPQPPSPRNTAQASSHHQQQQQQPRWIQSRPQEASTTSGPRQLTIGTPRHPSQQPALWAAAAASPTSYPRSNGLDGNDADGQDDDSEPLVPLVPATLPPLRPAQMPKQLPYNAPPMRKTSEESSSHPRQQQQQQQQQQYQSAHRSQYPTGSSSQQQQQRQRPRQMFSADDTASAVAQIFVNRDEIRSTEAATTNPISSSDTSGSSSSTGNGLTGGDQTQSYNLVINHMAPTRNVQMQQQQPRQQQQQLQPQQLLQPMYLGSGRQMIGSDNFVNVNGKPQQTNSFQPMAKFSQQPQKQQQQIYSNKIRADASPNSAAPSASSVGPGKLQQQGAGTTGSQVHQQQQQRSWQRPETKLIDQRPNKYDSQRKQQQHQATQLKSFYSNEIVPNQQQQQQQFNALPQQQQLQQQQVSNVIKPQQHQQNPAKQRGILMDLTNDHKGQTGVSSEVLNDGMLLLLRHGSSEQQPASRKAAKHKPAASSSQAIVVNPGLVSSNAPVDAQLFPNVQRLLNNQLPSLSSPNSLSSFSSTGPLRPSAATQSQATIVQAPSSVASTPSSSSSPSVDIQATKAPTANNNTNETRVAPTSDNQEQQLARVAPIIQQGNKIANAKSVGSEQQVATAQQTKRPDLPQKSANTSQQQAAIKKPVRRVKRLKATQLPGKSEGAREGSAELVAGSGPEKSATASKKQQPRSLKWIGNGQTNDSTTTGGVITIKKSQ